MVRTIKLHYTTTPEAAELIAQWRKAQSVVIRVAYNKVRQGWKDKEVLRRLRLLKQGRLDSWLTLSALKRSKALQKAHPDKPVVFGGRRNLKLRADGKISRDEWRIRRLQPLYFEGHAKSYGRQGGNHRFVLDIGANTIWFHPRRGIKFPLHIKLGRNSNYRDLLDGLQGRCTMLRDTPFAVSLTEAHICIAWDEQVEVAHRKINPERLLAIDLNPARIGVAIIERKGQDAELLHWGIYDHPELNRKLGKASEHSDCIYQRHKRVYELSVIAKEINSLACRFNCRAVITEHLNIETKDHKKGRSFNRAVNNQWSRKGFIIPLLRRLESSGITHAEVDPAYSSKLGNLLWGWPKLIPDPACAAVEIGRRFFQGDSQPHLRQNGGNRRKEERQVKAPNSGAIARGEWKRVWNRVKPRSGDTPRCTISALEKKFPGSCPRPGTFRSCRSRVDRLKPAGFASCMITMRSQLRRCV
ncbi:MAG: hypothetical protein ACLQU3_31445 [Limisphaerales bacterium]